MFSLARCCPPSISLSLSLSTPFYTLSLPSHTLSLCSQVPPTKQVLTSSDTQTLCVHTFWNLQCFHTLLRVLCCILVLVRLNHKSPDRKKYVVVVDQEEVTDKSHDIRVCIVSETNVTPQIQNHVAFSIRLVPNTTVIMPFSVCVFGLCLVCTSDHRNTPPPPLSHVVL